MTEEKLDLLEMGRRNAEKLREQQGAAPEKEPEPPQLTTPHSRLRRCSRCRQIYEEKRPRPNDETERLQKTLFITGSGCHVELIFCDSCYVQIVETPTRLNNESSFDVGSANAQPPNLLLQSAYPVRSR